MIGADLAIDVGGEVVLFEVRQDLRNPTVVVSDRLVENRALVLQRTSRIAKNALSYWWTATLS